MKQFQKWLLVAAAGVGLSSCSQEAPWGADAGQGSIRLRVEALADVESALPVTRDGVAYTLTAPPVEDFMVHLRKTDGSYDKSWSSLADFISEANFTVGNYELEVSYGDPDAQGFVKNSDPDYIYAYYYGKVDNISIKEGQTTDVEIYPEICNSIVNIEYSDEFKNYFTDWTTSLQSEGKEIVKLENREGMSYVAPGNVAVLMKGTHQNGKEIALHPADINALPGHMYKMKYSIYNDEVGSAMLQISFDEALEVEPVVVDLSDVLGSVERPVVTPVGFGEGNDDFVTLSGTPFEGTIKYNITARGGIKSAELTVTAENGGKLPSYFAEGKVDLCAVSPEVVQKMQADGIKATGLFSNPGQMAQLDLTEFCRSLSDGSYSFTLLVGDACDVMQMSDPVSVKVTSLPVDFEVTTTGATFGDGLAYVTVNCNVPGLTLANNPFTFKTLSASGTMISSKVKSLGLTETATRSAFPSKSYTYCIELDDPDVDEVPVDIYFNGNLFRNTSVAFEYPSYDMEYDAMAKNIRLRIKDYDGSTRSLRLFNKLRVYNGGVRLGADKLSKDKTTGIMTISGLSSATAYNVQTTLQTNFPSGDSYGWSRSVTTESETDVPNGDFQNLHEAINIPSINAGGQYKYGNTTMQNKSSILVNEPDNWTTINSETCNYEASNPKNTWFVVPSTMASKGSVLVRSVAYDRNGTLPALDNHGVNVLVKYSRKAPSSFSSYAAGQLIYEGSFASRPSSLTLTYQYSSVNAEKGYVEMSVFDSNGKVIASFAERLSDASADTEKTFNLGGYAFQEKASKIRIVLYSTTPGVTPAAPVPSNFQDVTNTTSLSGQTIATNQYKSLCVGSQLTVKKVKLNY